MNIWVSISYSSTFLMQFTCNHFLALLLMLLVSTLINCILWDLCCSSLQESWNAQRFGSVRLTIGNCNKCFMPMKSQCVAKKKYTSLIAIFFRKNNISQHKKLELCKEKESTNIPIQEYQQEGCCTNCFKSYSKFETKFFSWATGAAALFASNHQGTCGYYVQGLKIDNLHEGKFQSRQVITF